MNLGRRHFFHIVETSAHPLLSSLSAFFFLSSLVFAMHGIEYSFYFFIISIMLLVVTIYDWFSDIVNEGSFRGDHTLVVRRGLKYGFFLFIVSEFMVFFGFFWAFFHSAYNATFYIDEMWPPQGLDQINYLGLPLFNTLILIVSGISITWAHRSVALGSILEAFSAFLITILLGALFVCLQMYEYYEAGFDISDGVYPSTFYMLTGLHGFHVIIGVSFIFVCFIRLLRKHFTVKHYLGFVFAIWYWHFVDAIWILLYLTVYCLLLW